MDVVYIALFVLFAVPAAVLEYTENACFGLWERKSAAAQGHSGGYLHFRNNYVLIFSLMMGEMRKVACFGLSVHGMRSTDGNGSSGTCTCAFCSDLHQHHMME
eukprot:GHRQ01025931.1.p1 GENE.GHRQ01025931.1~~GHRQ01025931.1.p1  ORF type:complete len:103 (-),score=36.91 GHRQ01025931.1:493-801(-)